MEHITNCTNGVIYEFDVQYKGPISIPDKCSDGSTIKTIEYKSAHKSEFTSIDMSGTHIEVIKEMAFLNSKYLTEVKFPPTLKTLDPNSFGMTKIKSISLPNTVTSVKGAFNRCPLLDTITVDSGSDAFVSESNCLFSPNYAVLYMIGSNLRFNNIPHMDKIETIDIYCFSERRIEKFIATNTLKQLNPAAFHAAYSLKICNLSASQITELPASCFWDLRTLEKVILPLTLTTIMNDAINNCPKLRFVIIPEKVSSIASSSIYSNAILRDVFYFGSTFIDEDVFNGGIVRVHATSYYDHETFAKLNVSIDASNILNELNPPKFTCQCRYQQFSTFKKFTFIIVIVSP